MRCNDDSARQSGLARTKGGRFVTSNELDVLVPWLRLSSVLRGGCLPDSLADSWLHRGHKAWHDRTEQSRLFTKLCESDGVRDKTESKRGRNALQKRLLRARKYVHLVDILGQAVLDAAPVISISNLDQVSLEQIRMLPCSLADKDLVEAARQRCARRL